MTDILHQHDIDSIVKAMQSKPDMNVQEIDVNKLPKKTGLETMADYSRAGIISRENRESAEELKRLRFIPHTECYDGVYYHKTSPAILRQLDPENECDKKLIDEYETNLNKPEEELPHGLKRAVLPSFDSKVFFCRRGIFILKSYVQNVSRGGRK